MSGKCKRSRRKGRVYPTSRQGPFLNQMVTGISSPGGDASESMLSTSNRAVTTSFRRRTRDCWEMAESELCHDSMWTSTGTNQAISDQFETLPVTPDRQHHFSSKASGSKYLQQPALDHESIAIITQTSDSEMETEMDDHGHETHPYHCNHRSISHNAIHHNKRSRTGNYSFTHNSDPMSTTMEMKYQSKNCLQKTEQQPCWWKHKKTTKVIRQSEIVRDESCVCHVCKNYSSSDASTHMNMSQKQQLRTTNNNNVLHVPQKNSLLSYFHRQSQTTAPPNACNGTSIVKAAAASSMSNSIRKPTTDIAKKLQPTGTLSSCTYCDRSACNSCMHACEGGCNSNLRYCTFCSTINYDGPQERVLCFNCHELSGTRTDGYSSDCKMDITTS